MYQKAVSRVCNWGEVVKQVLQHDPDAVWSEVAGAHMVSPGRCCNAAEESLCKDTLLEVCSKTANLFEQAGHEMPFTHWRLFHHRTVCSVFLMNLNWFRLPAPHAKCR